MLFRFPKAGFGTFSASHRAGPSCWTVFDLLHVRAGALRLLVAGQTLELPAGCGLLMFPGTAFEGDAITTRCAAGVLHFSINPRVPDHQLPPQARRLRSLREGFFAYRLEPDDPLERDIERIIEWHFLENDAEMHGMRESLLVLILGQLERRRQPAQPGVGVAHALDRIVGWLAENVERDLTLAEMAAQVEMSESHFRAEFRQRFGQSPGAYFREARLREAARKLRLSAEPIKAIAHQFGFSDLPNFYRAFRNAHGFSPAEYRGRYVPGK
jgi:AraC-like DNA-binding protein